MEWGTIPGWITAGATLLTAVGGLLLAIKAIIPTKQQIDVVHTLVNQETVERKRYTRILIRALESAGIEVPEDQTNV